MSPRHSINPLLLAGFALLAVTLAACGSAPSVPADAGSVATTVVEQPVASTQAATTTALADDVASPAVTAPAVELPPRAVADFERAVNLVRAGNATEAELEFKQLIAAYPQLAAPRVNLALLYRKAGRLEDAEAELQAAVERNAASAVAWNELGVTRRMRGEFAGAAEAYEHAIAADANYAAAHRNFGVLLDLYLGDPERALAEMERYRELTGEEKPVSGWIAELRQRTGKPAAPRSQAPAPESAVPVDASPEAVPEAVPAEPVPPARGTS